ncbi:unnamed protein product [Sphagnum troendelagicum]|uniref:C2H2-type domain-containing protein n=1 Tax=Sphagnum troendelagicum TaxID=128251 RepID=A0ABP0V7H1_9BRYO
MDSMAAKGPKCEICAWTLRSGTDLEQHNLRLVHRTLVEAFGQLTLNKFQVFQDAVIFNGHKRGKFELKQELRGAALHECQIAPHQTLGSSQDSTWIIRHICAAGHSVPDSV